MHAVVGMFVFRFQTNHMNSIFEHWAQFSEWEEAIHWKAFVQMCPNCSTVSSGRAFIESICKEQVQYFR